MKIGILSTLKWYYIGIVAFFLFFCLWIIFSRFGKIRLGDDDDKPEFSYFSWFAMLFGCGMGIGLIFWSIAEPIYHFQGNPFVTEGLTPQAAQVAMRITFFHWGLHPWAIYVVVGLSLAYFSYRKKLPLTIRSCVQPLLGDKIYGPAGHAVDILSIFATIFGVATSLGFGVQQINAGLHRLIGLQISTPIQLILIAVITAVATISAVSGVNKGIRILSEMNLWMSILIMVFLITFGPTQYLLRFFLQSIGDYATSVIPLSLWTDANQNRPWQGSWTTFYWAWWIAWAPFVGMFIARISRGRTIREFVMGVLFVPTLVTCLWLVLFGGTALHIELFGSGGIVEAVNADVTMALYTTLDKMDAGFFGTLASILCTILVITYFITSSDSGTLVINTLMSVGDPNPPIVHRIIWGVSEGSVAGVLLLAGGLNALQTASVSAALPFSFIMLMMLVSFVKALRQEMTGPQPQHAPQSGEGKI